MKIVCILGSPKANGNTSAIVSEILRALKPHDVEASLYHLGELNIGYCSGCKSCNAIEKCVQTDDVEKIVNDMFSAQLVIVASPSYWGDVTGQMKVFIDRCTPYSNTNPARIPVSPRPKGIAIAVRAGGGKAESINLVHTIDHFFGHLDIPLIAHFTAEGIDSEKDLAQRPDILEYAYDFGKEIAHLIA